MTSQRRRAIGPLAAFMLPSARGKGQLLNVGQNPLVLKAVSPRPSEDMPRAGEQCNGMADIGAERQIERIPQHAALFPRRRPHVLRIEAKVFRVGSSVRVRWNI